MNRINNLDLLRFLAAAVVILSHAFQLTSGTISDPLARLTGGRIGFGSLGVAIFFAMSGYLITASWQRTPEMGVFIRARALRIVPAFVMALLLAVFVVGPISTTDPVYWTRPDTWAYLTNIRLHDIKNTLPGVFTDNPVNIVNGTLWTLEWEVACYIMVAGLGFLRLLRAPVVVALWLLVTVGCVVSPWVNHFAVLNLGQYFLGGAALFLLRDRVPFTTWGLVGSLIGLVVLTALGQPQFGLSLFGPYAVMALAFAPWLRAAGFGRYGDVSYGLYIYAYMLQQLLVQFLPGLSWWAHFLFVFPLAILLAGASWHLVEKPALALKARPREVAKAAI